jgi:hypothetical protein
MSTLSRRRTSSRSLTLRAAPRPRAARPAFARPRAGEDRPGPPCPRRCAGAPIAGFADSRQLHAPSDPRSEPTAARRSLTATLRRTRTALPARTLLRADNQRPLHRSRCSVRLPPAGRPQAPAPVRGIGHDLSAACLGHRARAGCCRGAFPSGAGEDARKHLSDVPDWAPLRRSSRGATRCRVTSQASHRSRSAREMPCMTRSSQRSNTLPAETPN